MRRRYNISDRLIGLSGSNLKLGGRTQGQGREGWTSPFCPCRCSFQVETEG